MSENSSLLIKTKISTKENFELIDYDSTSIIINRLNVNQSGTLIRSKKDTFFVEGNEKFKKKEIQLLKVIKDIQNESYFINTGDYTNDLTKLIESDPSYIVYKNTFFEEERVKKEKIYYKLSEGDIIKIGRVFIKVLRINLVNKKLEEKKNENNNNINTKKINNKSCIGFNKDINFTSLKKSSSYSSFFVNGQEVIKGSCSGIYYNNDEEEENDDDIFIINKNKLKRKLFFQKKLVLPRVTSSKDLLKPNPKKLKITHKRSFNLILDKNDKDKEDYKTLFKENKNKKVCRVCYGEEEKTDPDNPLISPCICKGSMKYIHYKCLKNWLESKIESSPFSSIELKDNIGMCYCTDNLICELCKTKFPDYVNYNGRMLNLTFYRTHFEKFLIFESLQVDNNDKKFIHILSFDLTNKITIGRANECDISFPEITVSRHHCFIHYDDKDNNLYLEDNCSRFGSLILIQNPVLLMVNKLPLNIQKNRTYIKIKLSVPFNIFSCCSVNNSPIKRFNSYQEQIEPNLNIFKSLIVKNNNINVDTEECDNESDNFEKEIFKKYKKSPIKIINTKRNKKLDDNLFLLRLKNMENINKFKNMKKFKKKFKIKELSLNKDSTTKNQNSKDIDTLNLVNTKRISIHSSGKDDNPINQIRLNINNHYRYFNNLNLFSLNNNDKKNSQDNKIRKSEE